MEFLDRERELAVLREHLTRRGSGMFILYGRRRIGKTALLQEVLRTLPRAAYHVATRSTILEELKRLSTTIADGWQVPFLSAQPLASSAALLAFLEGARDPSVLVLDEFPFLVESDPSLPGLIQASWDRSLANGGLKLVFCGSSVGLMEETFLSSRAPLFGRRTGQLMLGPLAPGHLRRAFDWDFPEIIELFALFGGVPGYLSRLDAGLGIETNLLRHVLAPGEPLYEEVPFLLREELREPRVYFAILATIAMGSQKFGEISSKAGLDRANLTRYLSTLIDLGLVAREVPITERMPEKSRKGLYRIADPFIATWFRVVHPFRDQLERGLAREVMRKAVKPALSSHLPHAVEPVVREILRSGEPYVPIPFTPAHFGRYWSETAELDVVVMDIERTRAFVAEIKWGRNPVSPSLLGSLLGRVKAERAFEGVEITPCLISRAGFSQSVGRARCPDGVLIDVRRLR
ncbi:MAG: ATP-binding protein [Acidobacteriota bacterium]